MWLKHTTTKTICSNVPNIFRGRPKFDTLLQMEWKYCSNRPAPKNAFLGTSHPSPAPTNNFKFISKILPPSSFDRYICTWHNGQGQQVCLSVH